MKTSEFEWHTSDGLKIFAREWRPEQVKAVVCLVHGFGEHCGRYNHLASHLETEGYAMLSHDLRGHGRSEGQRGHTTSYEALMEDIDHITGEASKRFPGLPVFLYGHSMGGNLVLNYALRRKPGLNGVIATGPWLKLTQHVPAVLVFIGKLIKKLSPASSRSSGLDARGLSHDPEVVRAYQSDPLVNGMISYGMLFSIVDSGLWALDHAKEFKLPLLIMHGGADPITLPQASMQFAENVRGDCTIKIWDGLYHEIHNEPEKNEIFRFTTDWLNSHI
ncbi:MAG: alpha/beta hydrolase [Bacillota bacterium]